MQLDAYVRVSRVAGRSGPSYISKDVQRDRISTFASANGIEILRWWEEEDQSGGKMARPKLAQVLRRIVVCSAGREWPS